MEKTMGMLLRILSFTLISLSYDKKKKGVEGGKDGGREGGRMEGKREERKEERKESQKERRKMLRHLNKKSYRKHKYENTVR